MISHTEAQELHELIGGALAEVENGHTAIVAELERARELAALVVADTEPPSRELIALDELELPDAARFLTSLAAHGCTGSITIAGDSVCVFHDSHASCPVHEP